MSLEFTGYHCTLKIDGKEADSGFSAVGPTCSPANALRQALLIPNTARMLSENDMFWTRNLTVEFTVGTAMPNGLSSKLLPMHNCANDTDEYNPLVHAFIEEIEAVQSRYGLGFAVNVLGRASITKSIIRVKAVSYNLEK